MRCVNLVDIDISIYTYIGDEAISTCSKLESVNINAITVGRSAFYRCASLKYVHIGKDTKEIGKTCFDKCPNLEKFEVDLNNQYFYSKDGDLYSKETNELLYSVKK